MNNIFVNRLIEYREKCDAFFSDGRCSDFLNSLGLDSADKRYVQALVEHSMGGKRIRAFLVWLSYGMLRGFDNADKVLLPSLSYELFQTGILAHDDIIDNSDYRRFKPSMHKTLGDGHDGVSKSICVGDYGIVAACEILQKCDFSDAVKLRAVSHQNSVFAKTISGELRDIEFESLDFVNEEQILDMYRLKTAQYTISGPLVLGAILAEADSHDISLLSEFGDAVGVSFQIKDDILGIFGDENKLGKSVVSDMCEGKKTVLTCHFKKNADAESRKIFESIYGKKNAGIEELLIVRKLFDDCDSHTYAEELCKEYTRKALSVLSEIKINDKGQELLLALLEYMTNRTN